MTTRRLFGLASLAFVVLLAAACGGSKKASSTTAQPPPASTGPSLGGSSSTKTKTSTSPIPTPTGPEPSSSRTPVAKHALVVRTPASTESLWPALGANLARFMPGQVEGKVVRILSIVKPDVIWIGRGPTKRILIHIRLKGEPAPALRPGQTIHIIGQLTETSSNTASSFGVKSSADQAILQRQGAYVDVSVGDLRLER